MEESPLPRLYREAPLNSIWEGSGNVVALDVLRAIARVPEALARIRQEIALCGDARVTRFAEAIRGSVPEQDARRLAETIALALQASLMLRFSVSGDAFCRARLDGGSGRAFGTLADSSGFAAAVQSAYEG